MDNPTVYLFPFISRDNELHREGVNSSSRYAIARSHALRLTFIFCLVLRLRGGRYPQYIFTATEGGTGTSIPDSRKTVDFTVTFIIEHDQRPLMLVEIKPPSDFQLESGAP